MVMKHSNSDKQPTPTDQTAPALSELQDPAQRAKDRAGYMGTDADAPAPSPTQNSAPDMKQLDEEQRARDKAGYLGSSSS